MSTIVFATARLTIRSASADNAPLFHALWTDPRVMINVGFPRGLPVTLDEIREKIVLSGAPPFDSLLVVERTADRRPIGECRLGAPREDGIAETDVKLLPDFWGHGYGSEVKRGLVGYLFTHTGCLAVEATPNVDNLASIRMQEAVGGVRIGEATYHFPETMQDYTAPVHHYVYRVTRAAWQARRDPDHTPEGDIDH